MGKRKRKKKNTSSQPTQSQGQKETSGSSVPKGESMTQTKRRHKMEIREFEQQTKVLVKRAGKGGKERKREVQRERAEGLKKLLQTHQEQLISASAPKKEASGKSTVMDDFFNDQESIKREKREKRHQKLKKKKEEKAEKERVQKDLIKESERKLMEKGGTKGQVELKEISKKLRDLKLQIHSIPADGNCLYSSISHQLNERHKDKKTVKDVRRICAFHLRQNKKEFAGFITETNFEEYCKKVESTSEWGGHLEIRAISESMKLLITVHQAEGDPLIMGKEDDEKVRKMHVSYHKHLYSTGEHYNSVIDLEEEIEGEES